MRRPAVHSLTSLRGLLACWVVAYHFWPDVLTLWPAADVLTPVFIRGGLAVPAFFILSGFVLAYNYAEDFGARPADRRAILQFYLVRLARVYPVHLVALLTVLAMVAVARLRDMPIDGEGYGFHDFVLNLLLLHTWVPDFRLNWNYPSWSISSEWFAYLLFPAVAVWGGRVAGWRSGLAVGACLTATLAFYTVGQALPFHELLAVVPTFFLGFFISRTVVDAGNHRTRWSARIPVWTPELLLSLLVAVCFLPKLSVPAILLATAGLVAVLALVRDGCLTYWRTGLFVFVGEVSYSLYMTHTLAQKVLYTLLPVAKVQDMHPATRLATTAVYLCTMAAWTLAMYFLVEKPARGHLRRAIAGFFPAAGAASPTRPQAGKAEP